MSHLQPFAILSASLIISPAFVAVAASAVLEAFVYNF